MNEAKQKKILKEFGKKLQKLRLAKKMSIRKFAYECDLSVSYVQKLETGVSNPSFTTLIKLLEVLESDFSELVQKGKF